MDANEIASINNGGTAIVSDTPVEPGGLVLGRNNIDRGTLEIRSGGRLTVLPSEFGLTAGDVVVGQTGEGHLTVLRGGELSAETLSSGGSVFSSIVLGQPEGAGTATVTINGAANLQRNTRIVGPNVDFSVQNLQLAGGHSLTAEITGANHSPISVAEAATLNGLLHVEFNEYSPSMGDAWNLIDAAAINGDFNQVTSNNSTLPPGTGLFLSKQAGGDNGNVARLSLATQLVLSMDRRTGQATIENRTPTESVDFDGYLITSAGVTFDPLNWNSLEDQGAAGWVESNPSGNHIGELNLQGSEVLGPNSSIPLGSLYSFTPTEIGQQGPEVAFDYHLSGGATIPGQVEFTGLRNNVVLLVDPETGESAIQNQSVFDVDVDGYLITSLSGSLDAENWESLADGQNGWTEANPSSIHLGELNLNSSLSLSAASEAIPIGAPFDFDAEHAQRDLAFEFHVAGGRTITGVVEYGGLTGSPLDCNGDGVIDIGDLNCACGSGIKDGLLAELGLLEGDFDGDGEVAFADFVVLSENFGQTVDSYTAGDIDCDGEVAFADFVVLAENFGKRGGAVAAAVPEPAGLTLVLTAFGCLLLPSRRSLTLRVHPDSVCANKTTLLAVLPAYRYVVLDARSRRMNHNSTIQHGTQPEQ